MTNTSPDTVESQLKRILASSEFTASKRLSQFLRYVVEQSLNGQSGSIKEYTVAVEALGYGTNFDPQSNPSVRVHARKLRRALDQYYSAQGIEDPVRIDIPKGRYVPVFIDNHAMSEALGVSECPSTVLANSSLDSLKPSIAVIMFDCLNDKAEFGYVATGLTEEIIIALTRFPHFQVVGPLHRRVIQEQTLGTRGIGREYGVRFVLDGTLRTQGQMLRLTVRLADAFSGQHLWGHVLDFKMQDASIMDFENEVVGQVASTIADNYGVIPRVLMKDSFTQHTDSPAVYDAILRYYNHFRVLTQQSQVDATDALKKALEDEPEHALAAAMLGDLIASSFQFGYEDSTSVLERAEELGLKAVALDPNCQPAHFTLGLVYFLRAQRTLFLAEFERAIELNPNNAHYIAAISLHLAMAGEWDRGVKLMDKACLLNPHHPRWHHLVPFMNYYRQGEYDLALIEAQRFNTPEYFWDPLIRGAVLGQLDRRKEGKEAVIELLALVPDFNPRARSLIRRFAYSDENIDMLLEGLRKVGLETQSEV